MTQLIAGELLDVVRAIVRRELEAVRIAEIGVVTELHPRTEGDDRANYACTVRLRDSGVDLREVPVATQRVGLVAIPNVDDLVLVQFVGGDLHGAIITGRLYNDVDRPPVAEAAELVYESPDEEDGAVRRVWVKLPNGNTLLVDDEQVVVEMGRTKLTVKHDGDVEVDSSAKVVLRSTADTQISADGAIALEAGGSLSIKAQTDVSIEGLSVSVKGRTTAQVEGQAAATLKGGIVSIAGTTSFSPG